METCEVTFDETMPCTTSVFECAGEQEIGESIFVEEEQEDTNWGDLELTPPIAPIDLASTTSAHNPNPSTSTTWGPFKQLLQPMLVAPKEAPAAIEGEMTLAREPP